MDVQPENVLQSQGGGYKLKNLFQTQALEESENNANEASVKETLYLAPEIKKKGLGREANDSKENLTKSDIFSLGIMVY